ncbi:protein of unknown function [Beijerinckiaceae bacterium RH AL1]|nr:protein of unknown function [Beijerinckiaceae bacterium RH AL8]VVB42142.1 protein of unknown function [Beijerinckiaceae bacterium RH CH11]VVC53158.1 protein of unknown function [Beijerinckiaceae bacterium RH AL1]
MYLAEVEISSRRGRPIKLTEAVEINKGNGKVERRNVSLYDIHTIRVSGITALLEAGLPPDLVMRLAGHSTIAMTMYYNKPSASALNAKLSAVMKKAGYDLDSVNLTRERLESISAFLVNSRPEEDRADLHLLQEISGRGDGSVEVMAHGICPGGDCSTGGVYLKNEQIGYAPVPRRLACSLCRYRLTGPMFLPGLVGNANRLIFELHRKGQEIGTLNNEIRSSRLTNSEAALKRCRVNSLYRETGAICEEWAAEVIYVRKAETMLSEFLDSNVDQASSDELLPIISSEARAEVRIRFEQKSEFALLQSIVESADSWQIFSCETANIEHQEILNEILAANNIDPFLLRLSGKMRDKSAILIGRAIVKAVPDDCFESLREPKGLKSFGMVAHLLQEAAVIAQSKAEDMSADASLVQFLNDKF